MRKAKSSDVIELKVVFVFFLFMAGVFACKSTGTRSELRNQISSRSNSNAEFLQLWASKKITVCLVNTVSEKKYLDAIKQTIVSEYKRIGFDLSQGWEQCPPDDDETPFQSRQALLKIDFMVNAPAPFGGSAPLGAFYGKLAEATIRADPLTHVNEFCHKEPETCMKRWAVHEVGHTFGLPHTHNHPLAKPNALPIAVSNADMDYKYANYLGDFDPDSIMSYAVDESHFKLTAADIRSLKALYQQPTVLLNGPSALRNGRTISEVNLEVSTLKYPEGMDYTANKPTHYRYKITEASESCDTDEGYSEKLTLDQPIKVNLKDQFKPGTAVKICALGSNEQSQQEFDSFTNLIWLVGEDRSKDYNFDGIIHTENCSGSFVRFHDSQPDDLAMVLINGHCLDLKSGEVLVNEDMTMDIYSLSKDGESAYISGAWEPLVAKKILYATFGVTDLALLQLTQSYESLESKRILTIAKTPPKVGTQVEVISGLYSEGFSCKIDHIADSLREGDQRFVNPMRYGKGCELYPGTSGSPVIDVESGELIGVNSTGNDNGEKCTASNPCEVEKDGKITFKKGYGYALQTAMIYGCLTPERTIDTSLSGCELPKASVTQ